MKRFILGLVISAIFTNIFADKIYTDPTKPIFASKTAKAFTIELQANPTTGYMWFLKDFNEDLLTIKAHEYRPPKVQRPGAPGTDVWTFAINKNAVHAPQMIDLRFIYTKPWDLEDQQVKVFTVLTTDQ